ADYAICAIQVYGPRPKPLPPAPKPSPKPSPTPAPQPPAPPAISYFKGRVEFALRDGTVMPASRVKARAGATATTSATQPEALAAYRLDDSYESGTRFRFFITTNTEAYLYAFATDLTGKVTRILP